MSPRALAKSGRPGIGGEVFPETAKELGRREGLVEGLVTILRYEPAPDGGGDVTKKWVPDAEPIRGRLHPARYQRLHSGPVGSRVSETSSHVVALDPDVSIKTTDRLRIEGTDYIIQSTEQDTEGPFLQLGVKEA